MTIARRLSSTLNGARWQHRKAPVQRTPDALWRELDAEFHFTLDAAASAVNAKCARYFTVDVDSLGQSWQDEIVWLNPPFRKLQAWVRKAWEEAAGTALVVMLIPSLTDRDWWHEYVMRYAEIRFLRGRYWFTDEGGERKAQPFWPLAVIVFRPRGDGLRDSLGL